MRAAYYSRRGPARDVLEIGQVPTPQPGPGEVRVQLHTSGVNPSDWKSRSGLTTSVPLAQPVIPHSDGAGVIDAAWAALGPGGRLVVNGITIETQALLTARFKALGGDLTTIQIAHADPVGTFHGMRPAMPVTQWSVTKP